MTILRGVNMELLVKTNDLVLLSFINALFKDGNINHQILDQNMSIMEGSVGVIPRRVLVEEKDIPRAKAILIDAGLSHELEKEDKDK